MVLQMTGCCLLLFTAQYFIYRINFDQFFQGDAIFWMYYRFQSVADFLRSLVTLDVAHWYRPLSNRMIPSLFFPLWGLDPYGYHWIVFASFFATSVLVFGFLKYLTKSLSVAFVSAFYFSIHSNNVYTTYDFAFSPDVFYVFFYVSAVWLFIEGERRRAWKWRVGSAIAFVLSLMSKEAAITLPAMLVLCHWILMGRGLRRAVRAVGMHIGVCIAYVVFVVSHLGVGGGDYNLYIHRNILANLATGIYYAFNLRRDGLIPIRTAPDIIQVFLIFFALVQLLVCARLLFRKERKIIILGALWFLIGLNPMILLNGLGPYYAFLAMVGFSLIVGMSLNYVHECLRTRSPWIAWFLSSSVLVLLWASCRILIVPDTTRDYALGYASTWAKNSMADVLRAHPSLPPGSDIYILNESVPDLWRFHGLGNLFKLVYGDDSITTSYRSIGHRPKSEMGELAVMRAEAGRLVDVTVQFRQDPEKFLGAMDESSIQYMDRPGVSLSVSPNEVIAGRDFYWLTISELGSPVVVVQYTIDNGPVAEARFRLNPEGKLRFFVSELTPIGHYRFIRFRPLNSPPSEWIWADATLDVLPPQAHHQR